MVIAAGRAYQDLIRWMKAARPRSLVPWRLARRLFGTSVLGAALVLGAIGLLAPARFGSPASRPRGGPEWWALACLVAVGVVLLLLRRARMSSGLTRLREMFGAALEEHPSFEPAVSALDSCPAALRTRFGLGWVWGPLAAAVLGAVCAASAVYFVIDAILARFSIGWQQPLLAAVNALLSLIVFRLAAKRLSIWRLSFTVHRTVTRL